LFALWERIVSWNQFADKHNSTSREIIGISVLSRLLRRELFISWSLPGNKKTVAKGAQWAKMGSIGAVQQRSMQRCVGGCIRNNGESRSKGQFLCVRESFEEGSTYGSAASMARSGNTHRLTKGSKGLTCFTTGVRVVVFFTGKDGRNSSSGSH
jgi:hypothetical protein